MANTIVSKRVNRNKETSYVDFHPTFGLSLGSYVEFFDAPQIFDYLNKSWVRTPNYTVLKSTHSILPDNSFNYVRFILSIGPSTFTPPKIDGGDRWTQYTYKYTGIAGWGVTTPPAVPDYSLVNSKLIKSAKKNQWNVPVALVEGRKTMRMVADAAERIVLMAIALKRGRLADFAKFAHPSNKTRLQNKSLRTKFGKAYAKDPQEAAANYWLQLRYGWLPFMSDVHNATKTLMDTAERPESLESSVRASCRSTTTRIERNVLTFSDGASCKVFADIEILERESYRATWRYSMRAGDVPGRFGLLNPLEVVWELVPLSFVVDWFLPIGDYLSSFDAPFRFTHIGGTRGYRYESISTYVPVRTEPPRRPFTGFRGQGQYIEVTRSKMTSFPSVDISVIKPSFDLSATQMTSALALLSQAFKSKK